MQLQTMGIYTYFGGVQKQKDYKIYSFISSLYLQAVLYEALYSLFLDVVLLYI